MVNIGRWQRTDTACRIWYERFACIVHTEMLGRGKAERICHQRSIRWRQQRSTPFMMHSKFYRVRSAPCHHRRTAFCEPSAQNSGATLACTASPRCCCQHGTVIFSAEVGTKLALLPREITDEENLPSPVKPPGG